MKMESIQREARNVRNLLCGLASAAFVAALPFVIIICLVNVFGDWIRIAGGSIVHLPQPVDVTIAEIEPGLTHYVAGGPCTIDERDLMATHRGIDLRVLGQEMTPNTQGDFLVAVGPHDVRIAAKLAICGARKIFVSPAGLELLREAARTQIPADQQLTTKETAERMATVR